MNRKGNQTMPPTTEPTKTATEKWPADKAITPAKPLVPAAPAAKEPKRLFPTPEETAAFEAQRKRPGPLKAMDVNPVLDVLTFTRRTVATLPGAAVLGAGAVTYVSDGAAGSPCLAVSNGTNWLRVALGAAVSTSA